MTHAPDLRLVPDDGAPAPGSAAAAEAAPEPAKVFVRVIPTPPGMPWDQARAATLETRVGAPLPLTDVAYQLKRIVPWAPGQPGRHAAFYVRVQEVGDSLETVQNVDGRSITIRFTSFAEQRRRARRLMVIAAATGVAALFVLGCVALVAGARGGAADRLAAAEQLASAKLHQATEVEKLKRQTRVLDAAHARQRSLSVFLKDLSWAASAKAAPARVEGLHWQEGYMAVEVRGEGTPFERQDRIVQKAAKPARAGVWLWGVLPADQPSAATGGGPQ